MNIKRMRCTSYSTAQVYNLKSLGDHFPEKHSQQVFPDALYLLYEEGSVFCFPYGCVVFWGLTPVQEQAFLGILKKYEDRPYPANVDEFDYHFGRKYSVKNDGITLHS